MSRFIFIGKIPFDYFPKFSSVIISMVFGFDHIGGDDYSVEVSIFGRFKFNPLDCSAPAIVALFCIERKSMVIASENPAPSFSVWFPNERVANPVSHFSFSIFIFHPCLFANSNAERTCGIV